MSLMRSHTSSRSSFGEDAGAKVDRQELYDELKRMVASNEAFTPVDIALSIGAGEPQVSKALLGLAAEGYLEKVETGKYRATGMADLGQAEFLKAFARASRVDSTISDTNRACFGYAFLTLAISRRLSSSVRSVVSTACADFHWFIPLVRPR